MLRVKVETFNHEADERGYIRAVNNYTIVEVVLPDTNQNRKQLLDTTARALGVPEQFWIPGETLP
jgi:hypothetical protein